MWTGRAAWAGTLQALRWTAPDSGAGDVKVVGKSEEMTRTFRMIIHRVAIRVVSKQRVYTIPPSIKQALLLALQSPP